MKKLIVILTLILLSSSVLLNNVAAVNCHKIQIINNNKNLIIGNSKITITDIENSKNYYFEANEQGIVVLNDDLYNNLCKKLVIITAIKEKDVYNINTVFDQDVYELDKDEEEINYNGSSKVISGDWVTNTATSDGTTWIGLDKSPAYGGLSVKSKYNQAASYELSGGTFLTCAFSNMNCTSYDPAYTNISNTVEKKNYVLYGEVNKYKVTQSQVGTGATRTRYIISNTVINILPKLETGTFSTSTTSTDSKILKNSTTTVIKDLTYTYTITNTLSYNSALTFKIGATGTKKIERYYKQYSKTHYYRVGLNALKRSNSEI